MKKYNTTIDPKSNEFKKRKTHMEKLLAELKAKSESTKSHDPSREERLLKKGKYPVRVKISKVLDKDAPVTEIGLFAADGMYEEIKGGYKSGGVVTVIGEISGKKCVVVANDPLVKSGAWVEISCKKNLRAQEIAMENHLPIIYMVDSAGVNLEYQAEIFPDKEHFGRIFRNNAKIAAMGIPQISCVFGYCVAGGAYLPAMSSEMAMITNNASMFLAGPFLVKAALGQDNDSESLGGAEMHNAVSGVADYQFDTEDEAFEWIREQMALIGSKQKLGLDRIESKDPSLDPEELLGILPQALGDKYDVRDIIARIVDESKIEEYKAQYGKTIVTCFARLGGFSVGIVANQGKPVKKEMPPDHTGKSQPPQIQMGNVIFSDSANKATSFIMLCNERKIPLIFLHDVTGFMVGTKAENEGIIKDGAKFVNAQANSVVPKFTVILRNSFGAGNYAMCGKAYDPRLIIGWPTTRLAVMDGGIAANTVLLTKKNLSDAEKKEFYEKIKKKYDKEMSPYYVAARMMLDAVVDPRDTRNILIQGLEVAENNPDMPEYVTGIMRI
ncbi:MAG: acyl-CoA carboxylase subunit beta [Candidatus Marinimicrobia bacterium]|nr:acyl-CoA carboxylase subunit beta [Candidatus Neomarinimicrobiota bacterium]